VSTEPTNPDIRGRLVRLFRLFLLCLLAAVANRLLNVFCLYFLGVSLFMDTVFTAAVAFSAGLWPGVATALLTWLGQGVLYGGLNPFIFVSIAEVLLVCWLKPAASWVQNPAMLEKRIAYLVGVFVKLMLLYIVCALALSVLGGLVDYVYHTVLGVEKLYFSASDTFKIGFLRGGIPVLAVNIFARIPVNMVDRFIVIFGGYFVSRGLRRIVRQRQD